MTSSLMPAMVMASPKGSWVFSVSPEGGSVSVMPPVVGTMTSRGIMRTSAPKSFFAEKLLALQSPHAQAQSACCPATACQSDIRLKSCRGLPCRAEGSLVLAARHNNHC